MSDETFFGKANPPPGKKYEFLQAEVTLSMRGFNIAWSAKGFGFGNVYFDVGPEGKVHIDSEYMSDQFVKELLEYMVSRSTKDSEPAPFKTSNQIFFEGHNAPKGAENPYKSYPECEIWKKGYDTNNDR
jgi:hypothetical protein